MSKRLVVMGDSFTEGVGDDDPAAPNGVRGWADRVAEQLAAREPGFRYANLAVRGKLLPQVLGEQLEPGLALEPDLVSLYAGGNDLMRPKVDIDALAERYDDALTRLAATGARLVVFTAFDPGGSAIYRPLRGRFALYNEFVRDSARRLGADVVDFWRLREYRDLRYWDADRMHMGPAGHQRMALEVLETLGVPHRLEALPLVDAAPLTRAEQRRENLDWMRTMAIPWVHRRLTGRSSGDGVDPKRSTLLPID